ADQVSNISYCINSSVNLELVHRCGREGLDGSGPRGALGGRRVHIHDQNRFLRISRFGKGIQISEVQPGVPKRKAEVGARIVMRHGLLLVRWSAPPWVITARLSPPLSTCS